MNKDSGGEGKRLVDDGKLIGFGIIGLASTGLAILLYKLLSPPSTSRGSSSWWGGVSSGGGMVSKGSSSSSSGGSSGESWLAPIMRWPSSSTRSHPRTRREYNRGLIVGDSLVATPSFTRPLRDQTGMQWRNVAVVGRNSRQILNQATDSEIENVDVVVASIGTNDGERSVNWTQENIRRLVDRVHSHGKPIILFTETPLRQYPRASQAAIRRSETVSQWELDGNSGADAVISLYRVLGGGSHNLRPELGAHDRLHPNREGRRRMATEVANIIRRWRG